MSKIKALSPAQLLTKRELEIVLLLLKGCRTKDISETLVLKPNTVSTFKKNIFLKLRVNSVIELYKLFT